MQQGCHEEKDGAHAEHDSDGECINLEIHIKDNLYILEKCASCYTVKMFWNGKTTDKVKAIEERKFSETYIIQHDAHKYVQRNTEEIHDGAPSLFRNVLGPHFHYRWPEDTHTSLKGTKSKKLETTCKFNTSTFLFRRRYQ